MDTLTPPLLTAVQTIRMGMSGGRSAREVFRIYLDENNDELAAAYRELWIADAARSDQRPRGPRGVYARALWDLMERGFVGEPIGPALMALEDEVLRAARAEQERHLATLPFRMLIPLLLLQFPAHLLLLLGPMMKDLTRVMEAS